jgi:hypothetical protein
MATLDNCIREANIPYAKRPQYKEKLLRTFDPIEGEMNLTGEIWEGTDGLWHEVVPLKFRPKTNQGRQHLHKLDGLLKTGGNKATQGLEFLTFSKEDRNGTKHIGATDLLKEMTRRRTANPDWDDAATIAHCVRSFRNDVAVWWQEVVPSDNSPKQLKKINTSWK